MAIGQPRSVQRNEENRSRRGVQSSSVGELKFTIRSLKFPFWTERAHLVARIHYLEVGYRTSHMDFQADLRINTPLSSYTEMQGIGEKGKQPHQDVLDLVALTAPRICSKEYSSQEGNTRRSMGQEYMPTLTPFAPFSTTPMYLNNPYMERLGMILGVILSTKVSSNQPPQSPACTYRKAIPACVQCPGHAYWSDEWMRLQLFPSTPIPFVRT